MPDYMLPDRIHLLSSLPRTSRGKVDREKLRKMAVDGGSVDRGSVDR